MTNSNININIHGQLDRKRLWPPVRVLFTVTGISLILGVGTLLGRYLLQLRANTTAVLTEGILTLQTTYSLWGRQFRTVTTVTPRNKINSIQLENRYRVVHLVIGFGFLMVGLFCGIHWLLNGLGAGYPYLFLIGAGVILAGLAIDIILFHMIPKGAGRSSMVVYTESWRFRLTGVDDAAARAFLSAASRQLDSADTTASLRIPNEPTAR